MLKHEKQNNTVPNQEELDRMYTEMLKPVELSDEELEMVHGAWGGHHHHHHHHHSHRSHRSHRSHHSHRSW
jgi:hypothetical protein